MNLKAVFIVFLLLNTALVIFLFRQAMLEEKLNYPTTTNVNGLFRSQQGRTFLDINDIKLYPDSPTYLRRKHRKQEVPNINNPQQLEPEIKHNDTQINQDNITNSTEILMSARKRDLIVEYIPITMEFVPDKIPELNQAMGIKNLPLWVPEYAESTIYDYKGIDWDNYNIPNYSEDNLFYRLGYYKPIDSKYFNYNPEDPEQYNVPHEGIINDDHYCDIQDFYIYHNPKVLFDTMHFVSDYHPLGLVKLFVMQEIGIDVMPKVTKDMDEINWNQRLYPISHKAGLFFTKKVMFHYYHEIGKHFLCFAQNYNHIPGNGVFTRKDLLVASVNEYLGMFEKVGATQCLNKNKFFPYAYRFENLEECKAFFEEISTEEYKELKKVSPIVFLEKIGYGAHRGTGVDFIDDKREIELIELYKNGSLCGVLNDNIQAQRYIFNALTIEKRKFDFRIYMLVASTNPLIVYYHDGFLRLSMFEYNITSTERAVHLTNTEISKDVFEFARQNGTYNGMNEKELREFQMWNFTKFNKYMYENNKTADPEWVNNYLRPEFKKAFIYATKMVEKKLLSHSGVFEMFGLDFMLDDQLNLWLIEVNSSPVLSGTSDQKTEFMVKMLKDLFDIEFGYLRSRVKRVFNFLKTNEENILKGENIEELKIQFNKLNKNYFEPEFEPDFTNSSFTKILDQNYDGTAAFMGNLDDNCAKFAQLKSYVYQLHYVIQSNTLSQMNQISCEQYKRKSVLIECQLKKNQ